MSGIRKSWTKAVDPWPPYSSRSKATKITELEESVETEAKDICDGKPYYLISKYRNLEQCNKSPFFHDMVRQQF